MKRPAFLLVFAAAMLLAAPAGHAAFIKFTAALSGPAESPPNASPGIGFTEVDLDTGLHTLRVQADFAGLLAPTIASHIHCCVVPNGTAMVATTVPAFTFFPLGVTSGSFNGTLDLTKASSFNPAFVTAHGGTEASAEAFLTAGMLAGQSYLNIHTTAFPGGEIRGFLVVPEPGILSLFGVALIAGWASLRRRRT